MKLKNITKVRLCQKTSKVNVIKDRENFYISSPHDVYEACHYFLKGETQECFIAFALNTKNELVAVREIFKGTLNSSLVHPREVFQFGILNNAASIIVCHNHPSNDPTYSREDVEVTKRLIECGHLLGIEVLDHIIYTDEKFVSLKEMHVCSFNS